MPFANPVMLIGLTAGLIPLILHLLNRRRADRVDWGAMIFLIGSVVGRNRRILLEEALLLALRCMLVALLAMAMAQPFVPPSSNMPWMIMLPMLLVGLIALGAGTALWAYRWWRWGLYAAGLLLVAAALLASISEQAFQLDLWGNGQQQDIAIIIDGSASMNISVDGRTNFTRAIEEAQTIIEQIGADNSVGIVLAGSTPRVVTPLTGNSSRLTKDLSDLKLCGGSMSIDAALRRAADVLADGKNPSKKVIIISDGQAVGWKQGDKVNWGPFKAAFTKLQSVPPIILQMLPMPAEFRNVQIADLSLSREAIGTDRPVIIRVRVENTGSVAFRTPTRLAVQVDDEKVYTASAGALEIGKSQSISFTHQFRKPGTHFVKAMIEDPDDQPLDNTAAKVVRVIGSIPVLLVEGNPSTSEQDLTSAYVKYALSDPMLGVPEAKQAPSGLFQITTVSAIDLAQVKTFEQFAVIVLCDVPTLHSSTTLRLTSFASNGGGLIIFPGDRCQPSFYSRKTLSILPAQLGKWEVVGNGTPVRPAGDSFQGHAQGLQAMATDISLTLFNEFWRLDVPPSDSSVTTWAKLDNGDPLIVERRLAGGGGVILAATSLGSRFSNLSARQICSPLIYEMVTSFAPPAEATPELDPQAAAQLSLPKEELSKEKLAMSGSGLRADYFIGDFRKHFVTVLDPMPAPTQKMNENQFSVEWSGSIVAPKTEAYDFELTANNQAELFIDGKSIAVSQGKPGNGKYDLKAGEAHDFRMVYSNTVAPVSCQLTWACPGMNRAPVPATAFKPVRAWELADKTNMTAALELPGGERRTAPIRFENDTLTAELGDVAQPGLYLIDLPEALRGIFPQATVGGKLPFDVRSKPDEGFLTVLTDADIAQASDHLTFALVRNAGEVVDVATKGRTGETLWRVLAVMALIAAVLEIALARWISVQRKIGVVQPIDLQAELREMHAFRMKAQAVLHSRPI